MFQLYCTRRPFCGGGDVQVDIMVLMTNGLAGVLCVATDNGSQVLTATDNEPVILKGYMYVSCLLYTSRCV